MHIEADRIIGSTVITVDTVAGVPAKFIGTMGTLLPSGLIDPTTKADFTGHVATGTLVIEAFQGASVDAGNTEGQVVVVKPNTSWGDNVIELAQVSHNNDGSMKGTAVRTALGETTGTGPGWTELANAPNTVVYNGNHSYTLTYNAVDLTSTMSNGMRARFTRTIAAPTKCTNLNGTTQYFVKTTPSGMTFTDDFTVSAWVKLTSYPSGDAGIISRFNGTSGWIWGINNFGGVFLSGYNASASNQSRVTSTQSLPLNKWVHLSAQLDMSTFTATPTTSYIMFDGLDAPSAVTRIGTNPTALIQAGNLEVGSFTAANFFPGEIAQAAVYNAKVTQATIRASANQTLAGTETSLISAYSFNNSTNDLNTSTANNLAVGAGSATATFADSPFAQAATAGTLEYGIQTSISFSTNTTQTVLMAEGSAAPVSGGVTAAAYATNGVPFGFPKQKVKWTVGTLLLNPTGTSGNTISTVYNPGGFNLNVPLGEWLLRAQAMIQLNSSADPVNVNFGLSTSASAFLVGTKLCGQFAVQQANSTAGHLVTTYLGDNITTTTSTPYYLLMLSQLTFASMSIDGSPSTVTPQATFIEAECAYL